MAGSPDITFLPSQQPEMGNNYEKLQFFKVQGINLMESSSNGSQVPLVRKDIVE